MKWLINLLKNNKPERKSSYIYKYSGLPDFLLRASHEEKIEVFTEAARHANEDQRNTLKKAEALSVH